MQQEKRKINKFRLISAIELIIILFLIIALVISIATNNSDKSITASTNNVRTKPYIEKKETYYQFDGKKILLSDGTYGEIYLPVYENVPAFSRDKNSIITRNGYTFYTENGKIASKFGIDVSEHQGDIDWKKVKEAGVEFAIIRVGNRTYGGGEIHIDEKVHQNLENAIANDIEVGVYFFSQAINTDEALEEADALLEIIEKYDITYPVVYDWEIIYDDKARTDNVPVDVLTDCCITFCERIKSSGYTPMIYQNKRTTLFKLDLPRLQDYDFWLAEYNDGATYYYDYDIWQYSCKGKIPGISGDVDLNLSFVDYAAK
ncbi:MAG: glycoside hydrolase family 25 protein [Ruminococcus sp.]|nr:glycoside hydrolase [Ruminococcus sp.]MBO5384331.1 glycoside hydrolase family 25 protein [Ruminococcus sp.]MBR6670622.1 glycoside hydrolase family 25 protein [Ruminococcus sp.]